MQIEASDLVKIVTGLVSFGAGVAFAKPFASRLFDSWLTRAEKREQDERDKNTAIVRLAASQERTVGVLEALDARLDRVDARLDRIESHHGISVTPSGIPSPKPSAEPRRHLTDPGSQSALLAALPPAQGERR